MIIAVIGCFALAWQRIDIPELLGLLTGSLVTGVGTMLAKTRRDPPPEEPSPGTTTVTTAPATVTVSTAPDVDAAEGP
jgi:hypothetical protein